jgi:hypothetical protein
VFSLLLNPWGRFAGLLVLAVLLTGYGIHNLREEAVAKVEAAATADALRRTQNAVRAGDAVDTSSDGLLKSDGHRRD